MSATQKTVPKFSSFRPQPPAQQPLPPPPASTAVKRQRSPDIHHRFIKRHKSPDLEERSSTHHHRSRRHDEDRERDRTRTRTHRPRHGSREPHLPGEPLPLVADAAHLYTVDTKGDSQNVAYQRLHKYSIPPYPRLGYGNILGFPLRFKIDQQQSSDDKVYIIDKTLLSKDRPQRLLLKRQKPHELPVLRQQDHEVLHLDDDFVALTPHAQNRRLSTSSNEASEDYRNIDRLKPLDTHASPSAHDDTHMITDPDLEARQTNAQLFRTAKLDPSNLEPWLDLASHQQYLVRPGVDAQSLTNHERQTLADMRIAIYEKALKSISVTDASSRERVLLNLLEEASLVWESQKYLQKLQDILQQHPTNFLIWKKYLAAVQTNPIGFRFEDAKPFFIRCLQTIKANTLPGHASDTQAMTLYLVLRYTAFLLDTGYDELSIAIWQALCEYHFYKPTRLAQADHDLNITSFEDFWESESPRFGETGAQGWCAYSSDNPVLSEAQQSVPEGRMSLKSPFKSFSNLERDASRSLRFPGRTMEDYGSEDPFHVVFFSDIKEVIEATSNGFNYRDFLDSFLCYLGLPPMIKSSNPSGHSRADQDWRSDIFLDHGLLKNDSSATFEGCHIQQYQMSPELLFSRAFANTSSRNSEDASGHRAFDNVTSFAKRALASLVQLFPEDETLAEYYLAFLLSFFPKEAARSAKGILKKRPSSLRLYNACAIIESKLGRLEKAAPIWSGAINMKANFSAEAQQDLVLLWRNWVWCDIEVNQPQRALSRLASFGGKAELQVDTTVNISTATMLRIRRAFKDGFEHSLSQSKLYLASLNAELLALTAYLTEANGLQASVDTIEEHCSAVMQTMSTIPGSSNQVLLELLHQTKAGIFAQHIQSKRPYKPAFIRSELESSIALFPNNTIFLELYRDNEARFRIDDRVRSILKSKVLTDAQSPVVGWAFAIDQEIFRYNSQASGSTAESVRATFNRALLTTGSSVKHSKVLWMKWFQFEAYVASKDASASVPRRKRGHPENKDMQRLKQVFLSGIHHLPWSKDWVLLGLEAFDTEDGSGWDARELRRMYNVLVERELRIRVEGLEDVLDNNAMEAE